MIYLYTTCNITCMQQIVNKNLARLGKRIKKLRLQKSKSLNSFVFSKGGVTSATWSRVENGLVDVKFNTLVKIASMLDVEIDVLLKDLKFDYSIMED